MIPVVEVNCNEVDIKKFTMACNSCKSNNIKIVVVGRLIPAVLGTK